MVRPSSVAPLDPSTDVFSSFFVAAGSVVHKSEANRGDKSRFIYTFHMIESPEHGAKYECVPSLLVLLPASGLLPTR
jgi:hypothetical protein